MPFHRAALKDLAERLVKSPAYPFLAALAAGLAGLLGELVAPAAAYAGHPFSPAAGVAAAAALWSAPRLLWPALFLGGFAANLACDGAPVSAAILGVALTLQAWLVRLVYTLTRRGSPSLRSAPDRALVIACVCGPVVSFPLLLAGSMPGLAIPRWPTIDSALATLAGDIAATLLLAPLVFLRKDRDADAHVLPPYVRHTLGVCLVTTGLGFALRQDPWVGCVILTLPLIAIVSSLWGGAGVRVAGPVFAALLAWSWVAGDPFEASAAGVWPLLAGLGVLAIATHLIALANLSRRLLVPLIALFVGWVFSGWIYSVVERQHRQKNYEQDQAYIREITTALSRRLQSYSDALLGGAGVYTSSTNVTRSEWRSYCATLHIAERYPGIEGVGLIQPVSDANSFVDTMRDGGGHGFDIKPVPNSPPIAPLEGRYSHFVVTYCFPEVSNTAAIGLDIASELHRRDAAERARDTGLPTATDRIYLVHDKTARPGFLLLVPIYRADSYTPDTDARRQSITGWVYASFITENFIRGILRELPAHLALGIYDSRDLGPSSRLFSNIPLADAGPRHIDYVTDFDLAGSKWTLAWKRNDDAPHPSPALPISAASALASLLVAATIHRLLSAGHRANRLVEEKTSDLQSAIDGLRESYAELARAQSESTAAHQEAEAALRELKNQKYVLDAHAIVATTDIKGTITYVNDLFCRISGYTREELLGQNHRVLNSGRHPREFFTDLYSTITRGRTWRGEICNRAKNGALYWVDSTICPIPGPDGKTEGYISVRTDITSRKLADERFRVLFEHSSDAHILIDESGTIDCNPAAVRMMRAKDKSELIGLHPASFSPEFQPDGVRSSEKSKEMDQIAREHGSHRFDWIWRRLDGEEFPIEVCLTPVSLNDRPVLLVVLHDISERVAYETALKHAKNEAERMAEAAAAANKAKSEFLATMSHEIRTPLNSVIGLGDILLSSELDEDQREWVAMQQSAGQALLSIINDILDISKLEAGRINIECIPFDPADIIRNVVRLLGNTAAEKSIALACVFPDRPIPRLMGDPTRIRQIVLNLVSNAVKFTLKGSVLVQMDRLDDTEDGPGVLRIRVKDTGIGMTRDQLGRLFQKFSQADSSTTRQFGGTGLGLAICRQLTDLMGGAIEVSSEYGSGTTFECRLPLRLASTPDAPVASPNATEELPCDVSVLYVDDDEKNRDLLSLMLARLSCRLTLASGGAQALDILTREHPDIILMDCLMPGMDGFETTRAIRRTEADSGSPRATVIALTANALEGDREKCLAAGMDDYLTKPIGIQELGRALQRNLRRARIVSG